MGTASDLVTITITTTPETLSAAGFDTVLVLGDSAKLPKNDVVVLTFDADLIASNQFDCNINGTAITPVVYATSNDNTMDLIATEIQGNAAVSTAVATAVGQVNKNTITITALGDETAPVVITDPAVTLGASQASVANVRTPAVRTRSYASLTEVLVDFATTDEEYIAAGNIFAQSPRLPTLKIGRKDSGEDWNVALPAVYAQDPDWYALVITTRTKADVKAIALWVETASKLFGTASDDANIYSAASTTDVAAELQALNYDRTFTMYSSEANTKYPEAAWIGEELPYTPGSRTWNAKTLTGIVADDLTSAQRTAVLNKDANIYYNLGNVSITNEGQVASAEYIDVIMGIDWIKQTMETDLANLIISSGKVPFTDEGGASIEKEIRGVLDQAITNGIITDGYTVVIPKVADITAADKTARNFTGISFNATLQGAVHHITVTGNVSV